MKAASPTLRTLATAMLAIAFATPAVARETSPIAQACRDDYAKHCKSVQPGGGRIAACLKQHESELAPACQATMGTISECSEQVKKICGTAANDRNGLRECLKAHASEFSASCRAALPGR